MRNHITVQDIEFIGVAIAGILFLSWFLAGRKFVAPPSSELPQTFVSSRFVSFAFLLFSIFGFFTAGCVSAFALLFMTDAEAGSHWFRIGAGTFMLQFAVIAAFAIKQFGTLVIWPDRLTLNDEGIVARVWGKERHWSWDNIAGSKVILPGTNHEMLQLILKNPDADAERRAARIPWAKKRDPRIVWLNDMWKPAALFTTGDMAVRNAILAVLNKRREHSRQMRQ